MSTTTSTTQPITKTLTDLLSHLVRMPTLTADQATNRAALDWVEGQIQNLPLHIHRLENRGYPALIATTHDTKNPRLWLSAHMDVVPASPGEFQPTVRHGRLYGRGTHDMKSGIAVFIALLQQLGSRLPAYDLGLMITTDEEIGGAHGVKWILGQEGYRGQAAYLPDSGASWGIEMGSKGIVWLEVTSSGRAAHASRTWDGISAIDQLTAFVTQLRRHFKSEPCGDPNHRHSTLNFGTVTGGSVPNQVAADATARLDIRATPEVGLDTVRAWVEDAKALFPNVQATYLLADEPYLVRDLRPINLIRSITEDVTGHTPTATVAHGSSDARFFAAHNIPTINLSPLGSGYHVPKEWIDLAALTDFYEITRRFTDKWCK